MCALEDGGVVELGIGGQTGTSPAFEQGGQHAFGAGFVEHPSTWQRPVHAGGGEHPDQGALCNLEFLDQVEAVEFGLTGPKRGQIPTLGRGQTPHSARVLNGTMTAQGPG